MYEPLVVRFPDGSIRFGLYETVGDSLCGPLFPSWEEALDNHEACGDLNIQPEGEPVATQAWTPYAGGEVFIAMACPNGHLASKNRYDDDVEWMTEQLQRILNPSYRVQPPWVEGLTFPGLKGGTQGA